MTHYEINTIEDCIKIATGLEINIDAADRVLISSINRQLDRDISLTDRQYALIKEKLLKYQDQLEDKFEINLVSILSNLRLPIREIDRSKTVKVSTLPEDLISARNEDYLKNQTVLEVNFPFNKKTIQHVEKLAKVAGNVNYRHKTGSRSHFFTISETIVAEIVEGLTPRNFEFDPEIIEYYTGVKEIQADPTKFLPMIKNDTLINLKEEALAIIPDDIKNDKIKLFDRRRRYGITSHGVSPVINTLVDKIVHRETSEFLSKPEDHSTQAILDSVYQLDRYPMVVVLNEINAEDQIHEIYSELKNYISAEQQSVLFRLDGTKDFNQYVKDKKLNNWVDKNTKVVYISNTKLPKLMLTGEFSPITCFMFGSSANRYVDTFLQDRCDLIIYRDNDLSPMRKHSKYYGNM